MVEIENVASMGFVLWWPYVMTVLDISSSFTDIFRTARRCNITFNTVHQQQYKTKLYGYEKTFSYHPETTVKIEDIQTNNKKATRTTFCQRTNLIYVVRL